MGKKKRKRRNAVKFGFFNFGVKNNGFFSGDEKGKN